MHSYMRLQERRRSTARLADESLSQHSGELASTVWAGVLTLRVSKSSKPGSSLCGLQDGLADCCQKSRASRPENLRPQSHLRESCQCLPRDGADGCTPSRPCKHSDPADLRPASRRKHQSINRSNHCPQPARGARFHQLTAFPTLHAPHKDLRRESTLIARTFITFLSQQPDFDPRSHSEIRSRHV